MIIDYYLIIILSLWLYCIVNCSSETAIRLVDGAIETEGRLEVCYNGQWGTVCDVNFWIADGKVACNQLGFANGE